MRRFSSDIRISITCDCCRRRFVGTLKQFGWSNSTNCPHCQATVQLEAGANAVKISQVQSTWVLHYQQAHYPGH